MARKVQTNKAPQVGLEPTTLRLTEGFHTVAGSCGCRGVITLVTGS
jgi:hypothetical protein